MTDYPKASEVKMKSSLWNCLTLTTLLLVGSYVCPAQTAQTNQAPVNLAANLGAPVTPTADRAPDALDANAHHGQAPAGQPQLTVADEIQALKNRIDDLENEVKLEKVRALADSDATAELKAAEKQLLATTGAPMPHASDPGQPAPSPAQTATPASAALATPPPPDIPAEITTKPAPFGFADWTWLNGNPRNEDEPLATKYFTPEFRADTNYTYDFNKPSDDSLGGSTETFRANEVQVEQLSFGGDLRVHNVRGRFLTMFGMFATTTPRNDPSPARGQWDLTNAYRYVSEAWGGYHWDVAHGLNLDAGIFVSYIGLFSYYNFDNWAYQPSYVSSNTPWFFNGLRVQYFPTDKLKIEPWFINGWQSYARSNSKPGLGGQILYRPKPWLSLVFNNYGLGQDAPGILTGGSTASRTRIHTDDSIEVKYFDRPHVSGLDKMAFSFTADAGCEMGGGVRCTTGTPTSIAPKQVFLGWMAYNRFWFKKDLYAVTVGGGQMNNPGRYLTLLPPINGANAITGTPYFTENPGDKMHAYDGTITLDYMPKQFITFRWEGGFRHTDVPYWTGKGGITPPGGNNGAPAQFACSTGAPSGFSDLPSAETACGTPGSRTGVWFPDLRKQQATTTVAVMVKF
jgi:hypothetical protein